MKKIMALMGATVLLSACSTNALDFQGKSYKLQNAPENAEITIGFDEKENRFFGISAVNRYMGTYKTENENITLSLGGSTMMMGPIELMNVETEYLEFIKTVRSYQIEDDALYLKGDKETLLYKEMKE